MNTYKAKASITTNSLVLLLCAWRVSSACVACCKTFIAPVDSFVVGVKVVLHLFLPPPEYSDWLVEGLEHGDAGSYGIVLAVLNLGRSSCISCSLPLFSSSTVLSYTTSNMFSWCSSWLSTCSSVSKLDRLSLLTVPSFKKARSG